MHLASPQDPTWHGVCEKQEGWERGRREMGERWEKRRKEEEEEEGGRNEKKMRDRKREAREAKAITGEH